MQEALRVDNLMQTNEGAAFLNKNALYPHER